MAKNTDIKSAQDKSITEPRKGQDTEEEESNYYKLRDGKKYYRIQLDEGLVDDLTEVYGTGEAVEAKHDEFQRDIFEPMVEALDLEVVSQERLDGEYGFLATKVESIQEEYATRDKAPRKISANKAFDVAVSWWTNK
jgi:hypothetical protein